MPRSTQSNQCSNSDKRSDRRTDSRSCRDYDDYEDDRSKSKRNLVGRSRNNDDDRRDRSHSRSRSRSRSESPRRNENNSRIDESRMTPGIQMKLSAPAANPLPVASKTALLTPPVAGKPASSKLKVASIFNDDDDDEPEEMPPECRMRMKNVGRETPTSAGPNSFGKTKIGFCNVSHMTEKKNSK